MLLVAACGGSQRLASEAAELEIEDPGSPPLGAGAPAESTAARAAGGQRGSGAARARGWAEVTRAPGEAVPAPPGFEPCAVHEKALSDVARWVAEQRATSGKTPDLTDVGARLRSAGAPYVWPRVWMLEGRALEPAAIERRFEAWLATGEGREGERRCGVARSRKADGGEVVAVIAVRALADLEPVPTRARTGRWLTFVAHLLVPAEGAEVVLLDPRARVRSVPTSLAGGRLRAAFSLDQPGAWRIQALASTSAGPRPVLEAWVFVDHEPHVEPGRDATPGEGAKPSAEAAPSEADAALAVDDLDGLLRMINDAREREGQGRLRREPSLDAVARAHAEAMRDAGTAAHDVGHGSPRARLEALGVQARRIGENVAHARDLARAHQALWASPSHRATLLSPHFDVVGLGIATSADGSVWLCELFAGYGEAGNANE